MRDPLLPTRTRERIIADNQAELEGWIDERASELTARGLPPDDARRLALAEFGDIDASARYAEQQDVSADRHTRATLWLDELASDLRIALRTLARTPTVTAVVLLTFALGIGATTAVFSVVQAMLLRPLPYGGEARLVYLPALDSGVIRPGLGGGRHSATALVELRERTTAFVGLAGVTMGNVMLLGRGAPEQLRIGSLTPNAFDVLQARAAIGRTFAAGDVSSEDGVVLLDPLWRRLGADSSIVGRPIELDIGSRLVIGVMPPGFRVPTYEQAELVAPQALTRILANPNSSQVRFLRLFGRLKPAVSTPDAQADVDRAMRALRAELPQTFDGIDTRVVPIRAAVAGDARPRLLVLMGAAVFVLGLACANVAGILLSRAIARRHELAVRVALGAGRRRLIRQFVAEGAAIAVFGAALGLIVAQLGIVFLRRLGETALPAGTVFALEPRVVSFAVGAAIIAAFVSSLLPALGGTRAIGSALRRDAGRSSQSRATRRLRLGLVAGQLVVSVVLLVGAGLFLRTVHRLSVVDLGYATDRALTFRPQFTRPKSNAEQDAFYAALYAELRAIPGVTSVGGGNVPTTGQSSLTGLAIEGRPVETGRPPDVRYTPASDDYFATLGIPIRRGRVFNDGDRDGAPWVAVVSERLVRQLWPGSDPIGARVRVEPDKPWATIVGVVGDVRMGGADAPQPSIYTSQRQDHWPGAGPVVVRTSGDAVAVMGAVRDAVMRVERNVVITGLRTLDDVRRSTPAIAERHMQTRLMVVFAVIAVVVSAIGVYGVSAYATEARSREFGIRMALGASRRGVLWLVVRDGASTGALGVIVGVPLAWLLASRMRDMLYEVTPFDAVTAGVVVGVLVLVVVASALVPARRATLIDPATTMRSE
jgi:putative ABC transport system permease protein